jgi:acetolactate decarboxylase
MVPLAAVGASAVEVTVKGALHAVMFERRTEPVAALTPERGSHTYALGPLAGLAGEFAIVDDVVWVSKPAREGAPTTTRGAAGEQACLIVSAQVPRWKRVALESDVAFESLDDTVRRLAERNGVDVAKPFPFLVEGQVADLSWHVIDGSKLPTGPPDPLRPPHVIHRTASPNGVLGRAKAMLVGFYSTEHRGVFTHHASDTHMHAIVDEPPLVAHVDGVRLLAGSAIAFPE